MTAKLPAVECWADRLKAYEGTGVVLFDSDFLSRWGARIWAPQDPDNRCAAELHTELVSRIAIQPLGYLDGDEVAALESVYRLFGKTRDAADKNFGANHFDILAWHVLNTFVRPFTAKWHPKSISGALSALDTTDDFRAELSELQKILRIFDELLLDIRDGERPPVAKPKSVVRTQFDNEIKVPLPWGVSLTKSGLDESIINEINLAERSAILARRKHYGLPQNKAHAIGLALSGGGIRSATFSLGVLIALGRRNLLPQFDYLSTVSGGGYLGSFLTTFLSDRKESEAAPKVGLSASQIPFLHMDGEAEALRYIRHRSKYLQTSAWERMKFATAQVYGMLVNNLALALFPAVIALCEFYLRPYLERLISPSIMLIWVGSILAVFAAVFVPIAARFFPGSREHAHGVLAILAVTVLGVLAWEALNILHKLMENLEGWLRSAGIDPVALAAFFLIPLLGSALIALAGKRFPLTQKITAILAGLSVPLFFLCIELEVYQFLVGPDVPIPFLMSVVPRGHLLAAFIIIFGGVLLFTLDINFTSPHRYYRTKLAETFLIRPAEVQQPGRPFDSSVSLRLSQAAASGKGPYQILNCALNVPGSRNPAMQGRLTDFFIFSPAYSGSPLTGYFKTESWEAADPYLDLGTAMAISGAAASPLMGLGTARNLSFWMALLNVRLGYWARKPTSEVHRRGDAPGLSFLMREMTGSVDESSRYLNLTDGGHVENLGVYELLRRRCKFIVAIDGEHDPLMTFHALTNLQRLAAIDLGVTIDIDLDDLRLGEKGLSRSHFKFSRIKYPAEPGGEVSFGYLLYLKLSLTGNEGEFLRRYRLDDPAFPHDSTANQFFTEVQFEAYRALGEHVGDKLFLRAIVGEISDSTSFEIEDWLSAIGRSLLRTV